MSVWENGVPDGCDCCGRDAEDCEMLEDGWVPDAGLVARDAVFCHRCAQELRIERRLEACAWCGVMMGDEQRAEALGWGFFADIYGLLHPCCPGCLAGVFGISGRMSLLPGTER